MTIPIAFLATSLAFQGAAPAAPQGARLQIAAVKNGGLPAADKSLPADMEQGFKQFLRRELEARGRLNLLGTGSAKFTYVLETEVARPQTATGTGGGYMVWVRLTRQNDKEKTLRGAWSGVADTIRDLASSAPPGARGVPAGPNGLMGDMAKRVVDVVLADLGPAGGQNAAGGNAAANNFINALRPSNLKAFYSVEGNDKVLPVKGNTITLSSKKPSVLQLSFQNPGKEDVNLLVFERTKGGRVEGVFTPAQPFPVEAGSSEATALPVTITVKPEPGVTQSELLVFAGVPKTEERAMRLWDQEVPRGYRLVDCAPMPAGGGTPNPVNPIAAIQDAKMVWKLLNIRIKFQG